MTDPNAFVADVHWKRSDGRVELELCAYSLGVIWLAVTETPARERRRMLAKLVQHDEAWSIVREPEGPACFDITVPGKDFGRLPSIPFVVENSLDEARAKIDDCMDLLREKGIARCRLRLSKRIGTIEETIEAADKSIAERTEKLEAELRAIDPNARLLHVGTDARPYVLREIIETDIGPLILEIKDADRFTLSSPVAMARHDKSLLRSATWKDGAWSGLPHDQSEAEVVRALGPTILSQHARDMRDAGWSKIAIAKHDLELDQRALEILKDKTLPAILSERDALESEISAPPVLGMR